MAGSGPKSEEHADFTMADIPIIKSGYYQEGWDKGYLPDPFGDQEAIRKKTLADIQKVFNIQGPLNSQY